MSGVPYTENDLRHCKKADLAQLINRQPQCWPYPRFNVSATKRSVMVDELLRPSNGFTRNLDSIPSALPHVDSVPPALPPPPDPLPLGNEAPPQSPSSVLSGLGHPSLVNVFIQDRRSGQIAKYAADITVNTTSVIPEDGSRLPRLQVAALDVVLALQKSLAALRPPALLSCPHYIDSSYSQPFAQWTDGRLEDCALNPESLYLSPPKKIFIFVDKLPSEFDNLEDQQNNTHESATHDHAVAWLKNKLTLLSGYTAFLTNQHRRCLQNPEIVADWNFAAAFYHEFNKAVCPSTNKPITRLSIQTALGIGETTLSDAILANRLLRLYGPGGCHESQNVVREVNSIRDPASGKRSLLAFLEDHAAASATNESSVE